MFGDDQSKKSAKRAFDEIDRLLHPHEHYQKIRNNPETCEKVRDKLEDISQSYWSARHFYERPSLAERKKFLEKLEKKSADLRDVLSTVPTPFKIDLDNHLKIKTQFDETRPQIHDVLQHLDSLVEACAELISQPAEKGVRAKSHVAKAASNCADLWQKLTDEKFIKNMAHAEGRDPKTGEKFETYVVESPLFVSRVVHAIDPGLTSSEVRSAISNMDLKKLRK